MRTRRNYTAEFKREVIEYFNAHPEMNVTKTAKAFGIRYDLVSRWNNEIKKASNDAFPGNGNPINEEKIKQQRELYLLRKENEILKKALAIFSRVKK